MYKAELVIPRGTKVVFDGHGDPKLNNQGRVVVVSDESHIEVSDGGSPNGNFVVSGIRYALKSITLPVTDVAKTQYMRHLHGYEISLLQKLRRCEGVVRIYDSEVRGTHILLLMELGICDFGRWMDETLSSQPVEQSCRSLKAGQIIGRVF